MPMLITVVNLAPPEPRTTPSRTLSANASMRSRSASTWRAMSSPPGTIGGDAGHAQRRVQYRAPFGGVDGLAAPHRLDARAQSRGIGQARQQAQAVVIDALAREIEIETGGLAAKARAARGSASRSARKLTARVSVARAWRARQAAVRLSWAIGTRGLFGAVRLPSDETGGYVAWRKIKVDNVTLLGRPQLRKKPAMVSTTYCSCDSASSG